ncbi:hypothetical protein Hanom_Chr13g01236901 [Helianthus anomalus]
MSRCSKYESASLWINSVSISYAQVTDAFLCNNRHGAGKTPSTKPDMCSQFHRAVGGKPSKLTFFIHIPSKGAPSIPSSIGAFLEL